MKHNPSQFSVTQAKQFETTSIRTKPNKNRSKQPKHLVMLEQTQTTQSLTLADH